MVERTHRDLPPSNASRGERASWITPAGSIALVIGLAAVLWRAQSVRPFAVETLLLLVVAWAVVWTLAATGLGGLLLTLVRLEVADPVERGVLEATLGCGGLIAIAAGLSCLGLFRPVPLSLVVVGAAGVGALRVLRRGWHPMRPGRLAWAVVVPWVVAVAVAATVSPFYDQWHQHLGFPWMWLRAGSVTPSFDNYYTFMPVNASLLYAYGLGTLGGWSAQVVHWWSGVVTLAAVWSLGRRLVDDGGGAGAVLLVATAPTVLQLATTAGSDLVVAMFASGSWIALLETSSANHSRGRWWFVSGACVGLAAGSKYTALGTVALPIAAAAVVIHLTRWRSGIRSLLAGSALGLVGGLLTFGPWMVRNLLVAGSPLFPFFTGPFRAWLVADPLEVGRFAAWLSGFDTSGQHLASGLTLGSFSGSIDGFGPLGLMWLACVPATVLGMRRLRRPAFWALGVGACVAVLFWASGLHVARYLVPGLIPAAAVLGGGLASALATVSGVARRAVISLIAVAVLWNLVTATTPVGLDRLGCTLGIKSDESLLARWVSSSPAFEVVADLPTDARVLLVAESRALEFDREVLLEHPFGETRLEALARTSPDHTSMASALEDLGVTHVLVNRWEARRIAEMRGRTRYFDHADGPSRARLEAFFGSCLEPLWSDSGVSLFRLRPACDASFAPGEAMATW